MQRWLAFGFVILCLAGCDLRKVTPTPSSGHNTPDIGADALPEYAKVAIAEKQFVYVPLSTIVSADAELRMPHDPSQKLKRHYSGANAQALAATLNLNQPVFLDASSACLFDGQVDIQFAGDNR